MKKISFLMPNNAVEFLRDNYTEGNVDIADHELESLVTSIIKLIIDQADRCSDAATEAALRNYMQMDLKIRVRDKELLRISKMPIPPEHISFPCVPEKKEDQI